MSELPGPSQTVVSLRKVVAALGAAETRPGQERMADVVSRVVNGIDQAIAVQAGTGTGKSLGYLVPALLSERKVVVATATKALQEQLATKDLPHLFATLRPFTWAVIKGRSNYLCAQKIEETRNAIRPEQQALVQPDPEETTLDRDEVLAVLAWADTTETGDKAELTREPSYRTWGSLSTTSDECPGAAKCPKGDVCFYEKVKVKASQADVMVVNTALYAAHLAIGGFLLPEHDVLILDEAHEVAEAVRGSFSIEVTQNRVVGIRRAAHPVLPETEDVRKMVGAMNDAAVGLGDVLAKLAGQRLVPNARSNVALADALDRVYSAASAMSTAVKTVRDELAREDPGRAKPERAYKALSHLVGDVRAIMDADPLLYASWVEKSGARPVLKMAPIEVSEILATSLWEHETAPYAVLTSATLPPHVLVELGLVAPHVDVGSPFDYRQNGLLYVPRMPVPKDPAYLEACIEEMAWLVERSGGRSLLLFTSYDAMRKVTASLRDRLPEVPIYMQGELNKTQLVKTFAEEEAACLAATMGFWQGIDVPGRTLTTVAIDKLPFPRPDEPLTEARRDAVGRDKAFKKIDLPITATRLAQGVGRLIRTAQDKGVVAVLDPRLAEAGYRDLILKALPPLKRTRSRDEVSAFLERILSDG